LTADSEETLKQQQRLKQWDRKKKKMVAVDTVSNENIANFMYIK
jgi:predicted GIY-YIG superfamily endonuclease